MPLYLFIITGVVLKQQQQIPGFSQAHKINNAIMNSSLIMTAKRRIQDRVSGCPNETLYSCISLSS